MLYSTPGPSARLGEQELAPLLFTLQPVDNQITPRAATPGRTAESSLSTQRRSQTPGSLQAEPLATPPPPIQRLDDVVMDEPSTSRAVRIGTPGGYQTSHQQPSVAVGAAAAVGPAGYQTISPYEPQPSQYEDIWVTVFGFTAGDINLVLQEFSRSGDIVQWGTFGQPQANFLHLQYQNKYGAQRALLRSGELLTPNLIVGVKPLDPRHRAAVESYAAGGEAPVQVMRPRAQPDRPYRVAVPAGQQMPMASRSTMSKVVEFVFGM